MKSGRLSAVTQPTDTQANRSLDTDAAARPTFAQEA